MLFIEFQFTSAPHNYLSNPQAAFQHQRRLNSGQRGMNSVAMTIISPKRLVSRAMDRASYPFSEVPQASDGAAGVRRCRPETIYILIHGRKHSSVLYLNQSAVGTVIGRY